jgi:hypothetical protein
MSRNAIRWMFAMSLLSLSALASLPAAAQKSPGAPQSLPVNVENTPSVNVANTPTVTLSSSTSLPVTNPPDNQGNPTPLATLEAVQEYASGCEFDFNGNDIGDCAFSQVPEGKQLVIQEFDASGVVETGNRPWVEELYNTIGVQNYFTYTFLVNSGGDNLATHQETRLYVAQQENAFCIVGVPQPSNGSFSCNISGFLVDVPDGPAPPHQKPNLALLKHRHAK